MAKKEEQEEKIHAFYRTAAAEREEKITTQSQDLYKNTLSLLQDLLLQSKLVEAAKGNAAHLNRQAAQFKALLEALGGEASKKDIAAKNAEATKQFKALQGKQLGAALNGAKE